MTKDPSIGEQIKDWRERRGVSQMELALSAEVSARHLSFVETGRATPGRGLVLRVMEELNVPLRERNLALVAAGFAPIFSKTRFCDPAFDQIRSIVAAALDHQKPFPGYVVDRHWNVVASNSAVPELYEGVSAALTQPPLNVVRMILHPQGFGERLLNRAAWRTHLLGQLRRQIAVTGDEYLVRLWEEAVAYPGPCEQEAPAPGPAIPLDIMTSLGKLCFVGATTVFGTPLDVTTEEIAMELLYPADAFTDRAVRKSAANDR